MMEESEEGVGQGEGGGGGGGGRGGGEDEQKGQRPLGCLSESLGMSLGSLLEASWGVLGASWRSRGLLGASWVPRGSLLGPLGGLLGASWGPLGGLLGPPGRLLGPSWRPSIKKRVDFLVSLRRSLQMGLLGPSWGDLGLGLSWGSLGPSWGHLEASEAHRKRKGDNANISGCFQDLEEGVWRLGGLLGGRLGPLKPSWGGVGASCRCHESYLAPWFGYAERPWRPCSAV